MATKNVNWKFEVSRVKSSWTSPKGRTRVQFNCFNDAGYEFEAFIYEDVLGDHIVSVGDIAAFELHTWDRKPSLYCVSVETPFVKGGGSDGK